MRGDTGDVDERLAARVAAMSRGSQRWLKTALQTIDTNDDVLPSVEASQPDALPAVETPEPPARRKAKQQPPRENPANLEDVVTGKADLREHLDAYPELAEELDGLADVIDLLREAGDRRRKKGEQILREEILGGEAEAEGNGDNGEDAG